MQMGVALAEATVLLSIVLSMLRLTQARGGVICAALSHKLQVNRPPMTYIVTDACVKCKFMDCVEVCPVDCFYEGENFLVIAPDECIDCGVCEPECPIDAIKPDTEDEPDGKWLQINASYAKVWPNITVKGTPPADREEWERVEGKFEKYFSPEPGKGS